MYTFATLCRRWCWYFFSASFRGLLQSSSLQGGIKLHARYNLTLSSFIHSYSPDLMQISYLCYIFFFKYLLFIFLSSQHDQFRKTFEFKPELRVQLISKGNCQTVNSSKKRTNEFVFNTKVSFFHQCSDQ